MDFTIDEMQKLADLQIKTYNIRLEIDYLKKMLKQLSSDQCQVQLQFTMHNQTTCERVKAQATSDPATQELQQVVVIGFNQPHKECQLSYLYKFNESTALRILGKILEERKKDQEQLHIDLKKLLQKVNPVPTQFVYEHNDAIKITV